ncbi:hypothetical protein O0L34_g5019 [Tuta absoluta]|nr:hypothetical protein O0L34_g5019 [Tuta absoluta]
MSQWNNSYQYQGGYQSGNTWNGDANSQFVNQPYYPGGQYDQPSNQYVSFNEFLSQMQGNNAGAPATASFNNTQYPTYEGNQYTYQNLPSSSQNTPEMASYNSPSNNATVNKTETYQAHALNQYNPPPQDLAMNDVPIKSNLTATATEFVPKSSTVKPSSSAPYIKSEPSKPRNSREPKSTSSSDTNWRERPQTSGQSSGSRNDYGQNGGTRKDYGQNGGTRNDYAQDDSSQNDYVQSSTSRNDYRHNSGSRNDYRQNDRYDSNNSYRQDSNNHKQSNSRYNESTSRNTDSNYHSSNNRSYDRNYESKNNELSNHNDRYESQNNDSNNRCHERNQKGNSKSNKYSKEERTYYNSSINKQEKNGREDSRRGRNYTGSSRVRAAVDRNMAEEEQFASSYLQFKEEKRERDREEGGRGRETERITKENMPSPRNRKKPTNDHGANNKEMTQRERLSEQLDKGTLECLVCCDRVKQTDPVWSCANCYHVLHLRCIRKWATSSSVEGKWRCPACQNTSEEVPNEYWCMCGAKRNPEWQRGAMGAHTCGRGCRRPRPCPHPCPLTCHPGPCPPCTTTVTKHCGCGADTRTVLCSDKAPLVCGRVCNRLLACGVHACAKECHEGACGDCTQLIIQVCYCEKKEKRSVPCTASHSGVVSWSCGAPCSLVLACGAHLCDAVCHPPPCPACARSPDTVRACPCGHTKLSPESRRKCTDPIPTCDNICLKPLTCGPPDDKHFCKQTCHNGECPVCPDKTLIVCRCKNATREVPCAELPDMDDFFLCQKKCNKKLSCGRHRCRAVCCADKQHRCGVVCGRFLACGLHRCEQFCHTGHCAPCPRLEFQELSCECGAEVILPPIACGTKPPACTAPCRRRRVCGHPPHHSCHSGDCPPCVVLTTKMCYGQHEERKTIPCSQDEFSCGLPCGKPLPCGKHTCIKTCHKGPCDTGKCMQPCTVVRPSCGHPCAAPCHADNAGACPSNAPCKRTVRATCPCTRKHADRTCADNSRDRAKILSALAASKVQEGGTVDITEMRPSAMLKTLECDDECRVEARTRQLALALQIRNPDVSSKLAPRYSDHVRNTAVKEPAFAQQIHDKLTELVQLAKKSKQKTRSHSFPSMNWARRQFVHELCEQFGCESVAYDAEPNRNVVATADREKSWLPAMSILEVLAREAGKRRIPGPVLRAPAQASSAGNSSAQSSSNTAKSSGWATLTSTNAWASRSAARPSATASNTSTASAPAPPATPAPAKIDYFDNPPDN